MCSSDLPPEVCASGTPCVCSAARLTPRYTLAPTHTQTDSSRKFYSSLRAQIPTSAMAEKWLLERGLLEGDELDEALANAQSSNGYANVTRS